MRANRFFALFAVVLFGWISASATAASKPNILVIVADDLGGADVGFNGGKIISTPNLDRLAATGVRLTDFRAAPVCSPTRAGFLTGRWPIRFGMMRAVVPPWSTYGLPKEEITLPEALGASGYEQRALIGKWHLGHTRKSQLPRAHGFTHFYGHYNGAIDYFTHARENEIDWHRNETPLREEGYSTDLLGAEAVRMIRAGAPGKPWFVYVAFNAPHSPFQARPGDMEKYAKLPRPQQIYAAMVDRMDQAIGKILEAVESRADADNTLVLFFSDNGGVQRPASSNAPYRGFKANVYEGGTRVAAAIRWPKAGIAGGKLFDQRVGYIDVMPTLLAAAGTKAISQMDGLNILPALRGESEIPERPWFSYIHQNEEAAHASAHLGKWKLVTHGDFFAAKPATEPKRELYDINADPAEKTDLASQYPNIVSRLAQKIREFGSWEKEGVTAYGEGREGFKAPKDWVITAE